LGIAETDRRPDPRLGPKHLRPLRSPRHPPPPLSLPLFSNAPRASSQLPPHLLRRAIRQAKHKGHHLKGIESDRTRSDLETAFWRDQRLVVEADFFAYHRGSVAWEDDHARDLDLRQLGYTVLRFTDKQLEDEPDRIAADIAAEFSGSRRTPSLRSLPRGCD
jgi:very-short-patch-repair endonuclease